jgi:8-amino-7-oxononanoate synthase
MSTLWERIEAAGPRSAVPGAPPLLREVQDGHLPRLRIDGRERLVLCSNDYLGLSAHPRVIEAGCDALRRHGLGNAAGRSVVGTTSLHLKLEERLAVLGGFEAALLFTSAYTANLGLLCTLLGPGDIVFSDRLNHASLIDGCRFSGAQVQVYEHLDAADLARKLAAAPRGAPKAVVTDGVFSMDGEVAPLPQLLQVAREHDALLIVDDAHAVGVMGPGGGGTPALFGLERHGIVQVGTIGKALGGGVGGYVAGSRALRELLVRSARNFIFTNPPPAAIVGGSLAALDVLAEEPQRLARLHANAARLREGLTAAGFEILPGEAPIVPLLVRDAAKAMAMSAALDEHGLFVSAFAAPVVPAGTERLRLIASAAHEPQDIERAVELLGACGRLARVIA